MKVRVILYTYRTPRGDEKCALAFTEENGTFFTAAAKDLVPPVAGTFISETIIEIQIQE